MNYTSWHSWHFCHNDICAIAVIYTILINFSCQFVVFLRDRLIFFMRSGSNFKPWTQLVFPFTGFLASLSISPTGSVTIWIKASQYHFLCCYFVFNVFPNKKGPVYPFWALAFLGNSSNKTINPNRDIRDQYCSRKYRELRTKTRPPALLIFNHHA